MEDALDTGCTWNKKRIMLVDGTDHDRRMMQYMIEHGIPMLFEVIDPVSQLDQNQGRSAI